MRPTGLFLSILLGCSSNSGKSDDTDSGTDSGTAATDDSEDPVVPDCSWFSGDNCWKQAIRAVESCLPESPTEGTFASDFQTCTFEDGSQLNLSGSKSFSTPFAWSGLDLRGFSLVNQGGSTCITYLTEKTEQTSGWTVGTSEGEVRYSVPDLQSFGGLLTCPDGIIYDLGLDVLSCPDANAHWPFISHAATSIFLSYDLQGGDETVGVFNCTGS